MVEVQEQPSLVRGRWLWATVVVVVGVLVMARLGIWQLQRLQERRDANAALTARLSQPPVTLTGQAVDPDQLDLRRASVRGTYDFRQEVVLRNQALNERPGVHVITPLHITGSDSAVLVDRGWIPYTQASQEQRAAFDQPAGEVEVRGIIQRSQQRLNFLSPADPQPTPGGGHNDAWFRVDIPRLQEQVPYRLLPVYLQEGEVSDAPPAVTGSRLPLPYVEVDLSEGPHLGYAIQWFAFAAILAGGYVLLYRQRAGSHEVGTEQDDA